MRRSIGQKEVSKAALEALAAIVKTPKERKSIDLSRKGFRDVYLPEGTNLSHFSFMKSTFRGAYLRGVDLSHADLSYADLRRADLRQADLRQADLHKADLREAGLNGANLSDTNLSDAKLNKAGLIKANLSRADLGGADLSDTFLCGADLFEANLIDAKLIHADLTAADLSGSRLSRAKLEFERWGEGSPNRFIRGQKRKIPIFFSWGKGSPDRHEEYCPLSHGANLSLVDLSNTESGPYGIEGIRYYKDLEPRLPKGQTPPWGEENIIRRGDSDYDEGKLKQLRSMAHWKKEVWRIEARKRGNTA